MRFGIWIFILCLLWSETATLTYEEYYAKSRASNYVNPWSWLFDDLLTKSAKAPKHPKSFIVDETLVSPEPEDQEVVDTTTTTTTKMITKRPTTTSKPTTIVKTTTKNLLDKLFKEEDTVYRTKEAKPAVVRRILTPKILFDSEKPDKKENGRKTTTGQLQPTKKHVTTTKVLATTTSPIRIDDRFENLKPKQNTDLLFKHSGLTRLQINYANKPKPKPKVKTSIKPVLEEDEQVSETVAPKTTKKALNKKPRISTQERKVQTTSSSTTAAPSTTRTTARQSSSSSSSTSTLLTDHEEEVEQAKEDWQNAKKILGQSFKKGSSASTSSSTHFSTSTRAGSSKLSTKPRLITWSNTETKSAAPDYEETDSNDDAEKLVTVHPLPTNRPDTVQGQHFIIPPPIPVSNQQKSFLKAKSEFLFDKLPKTLEEVRMVPAAKQLPLVVPSLLNTDSEATKLAVRQGILDDGRMDWLVSYNDPRHPNFG